MAFGVAMDGAPLPPALVTFKNDLQMQNMFQTGLFSLLIYDHLLNFGEEVERIWKKPWTGASILFVLNRYLTPLEFIVVMTAFQSEWPAEVCRRFVKYEGAGSVTVTGICQIVMILRVYALYGGNKLVLLVLVLVFLAQIGVQAAVLAEGIPLQVPIPTGCILIGRTSVYAGLWIGPLVTDSCIFLLTLWRSKEYLQRGASMPTFRLFLRDGIAYFFVIFSVNLLNVVVYFSVKDESLKPFFAPFSELMTSIMISRIVLNLRGYTPRSADDDTFMQPVASQHASLAFAHTADATGLYTSHQFTDWRRVVGNLGEPVIDELDEEYYMDSQITRRERAPSRYRRNEPVSTIIPLKDMHKLPGP